MRVYSNVGTGMSKMGGGLGVLPPSLPMQLSPWRTAQLVSQIERKGPVM